MTEIMICGEDCHPGDGNCNGYCIGKADAPPTADPAMVIARKRARAFDAYEKATEAWYEYFSECEVGPDREVAHEIYEKIRTAIRVRG